MALQIKNNSGIFEINGSLNAQNTQSFKSHFEVLLENSKMITVSLNNVTDFDSSGLQTIVSLYKKALVSNKVFYILGQENSQVVDLFSSERLNYMLRRDVA